MARDLWTDLVLHPRIEQGDTLGTGDDPAAWELFHENSKSSRYERSFPPHHVVWRMQEMCESLEYDQYPEIELPRARAPFEAGLEEALLTRTSAHGLAPIPLRLEQVAAILHCAYGVTRDNAGTVYPRPFRSVPSAGALYPLEIYFHSSHVDGLAAGLYHYNPARISLRRLREGDLQTDIAAALVQPEVAYDASMIMFITALFERSTFKYGERGYRFTLLETGHVAQNVNLAANGLRLGSLNIGGFLDRQIDELIGLDGVTHSTLYLVAIGQERPDAPKDMA